MAILQVMTHCWLDSFQTHTQTRTHIVVSSNAAVTGSEVDVVYWSDPTKALANVDGGMYVLTHTQMKSVFSLYAHYTLYNYPHHSM